MWRESVFWSLAREIEGQVDGQRVLRELAGKRQQPLRIDDGAPRFDVEQVLTARLLQFDGDDHTVAPNRELDDGLPAGALVRAPVGTDLRHHLREVFGTAKVRDVDLHAARAPAALRQPAERNGRAAGV